MIRWEDVPHDKKEKMVNQFLEALKDKMLNHCTELRFSQEREFAEIKGWSGVTVAYGQVTEETLTIEMKYS